MLRILRAEPHDLDRPSEKDAANDALEKRLWAAANQLWAGAGLKQSEYSEPVLGLIFLRFAEDRFAKRWAELEKAAGSSRRGSRLDDPTAYHSEAILHLPATSRYEHLLNLPEGTDIGQAVNDAMRARVTAAVRAPMRPRKRSSGARHSSSPSSLATP